MKKRKYTFIYDEWRLIIYALNNLRNSLMESIVDRFGERLKTAIVDDKHFSAEIEVSVSTTFFGWVVGFGGRMSMVAPNDVV